MTPPIAFQIQKTACPVFRGSRIRLLIPRHWLERLSAPHSSVTVRHRQRCRTAGRARAPWNKWKGPTTAQRWREGGRLCRERPLRSTRAALRFACRMTDECRHADRCRGHVRGSGNSRRQPGRRRIGIRPVARFETKSIATDCRGRTRFQTWQLIPRRPGSNHGLHRDSSLRRPDNK